MTEAKEARFVVSKETKSQLLSEHTLFHSGIGIIASRHSDLKNFFNDVQGVTWEKSYRAEGGIDIIIYRTEHIFRFEVLIMTDHAIPREGTPGEVSAIIESTIQNLCDKFSAISGTDTKEKLYRAITALTGLTVEQIEEEALKSDGTPLREFFGEVITGDLEE